MAYINPNYPADEINPCVAREDHGDGTETVAKKHGQSRTWITRAIDPNAPTAFEATLNIIGVRRARRSDYGRFTHPDLIEKHEGRR